MNRVLIRRDDGTYTTDATQGGVIVTGEIEHEAAAQGDDHSIFGPSKWDRLLTCPGSLLRSLHYVNGSGAAAAEGTAGHWVHEQLLQGLPVADVAPNGVPITQEMTDAAQDSVTRVQALHAQIGGDLLVEQRFDISHLTPIGNQFGTADVVIAAPGALAVVDLKMGRGEVDVATTHQLAAYALGAFEALDWLYDFQTITTAIHQPRLGAFDQRVFTRDELLALGQEMKAKLARCVEKDAALVPSAVGCKFCPALADCPAVAKQTADMIDATFDDLADPIAQALAWEPIATAFFKATRAKALAKMCAGGSVEGWKPVEGITRRVWLDDVAVVKALGERAYTMSLISPSEAEKLGVDKKVVAALTRKPKGKVTLALASDKRARYDGDFSNAFGEEE